MSICKSDGVYDLELAYINAENDMDWLSSKVEELQSALDIKIDGKIETVEDQAQLQDEHNKLKITRFAQPYCCWETSENGVNTADADADNMELFILTDQLLKMLTAVFCLLLTRQRLWRTRSARCLVRSLTMWSVTGI